MCSVQSRVCISVTQCSKCCTISHFSFNGFLVLQSPCCLIYALILISVVLIINAERCLSKCISALSHHRCLALGQSLRGNWGHLRWPLLFQSLCALKRANCWTYLLKNDSCLNFGSFFFFYPEQLVLQSGGRSSKMTEDIRSSSVILINFLYTQVDFVNSLHFCLTGLFI